MSETEYIKRVELRKKTHPEHFPEERKYTKEELRKYEKIQEEIDRRAGKKEREKDYRLSRRRVRIDPERHKPLPPPISQEEYKKRYIDPKRVRKPPQKKKKKRKTSAKRKSTAKRPVGQGKKKSVLENGFFEKAGRKFTLAKEYSVRSEAEKELKKLRDENYYVELSSYTPRKHNKQFKIFKGPKKKK